MVKCPECGEVLNDNDKRCPNCGHKMAKEVSSDKNKGSTNKIIAIVAVVVIIAIIGVLASGMFSNNNPASDSNVKSDEEVTEPVTQDNDSDDSDSSSYTGEYWASDKANKFHLPDCEWAEKISEDNKIIYQTREDAINDGKEPCGVCNP